MITGFSLACFNSYKVRLKASVIPADALNSIRFNSYKVRLKGLAHVHNPLS